MCHKASEACILHQVTTALVLRTSLFCTRCGSCRRTEVCRWPSTLLKAAALCNTNMGNSTLAAERQDKRPRHALPFNRSTVAPKEALTKDCAPQQSAGNTGPDPHQPTQLRKQRNVSGRARPRRPGCVSACRTPSTGSPPPAPSSACSPTIPTRSCDVLTIHTSTSSFHVSTKQSHRSLGLLGAE